MQIGDTVKVGVLIQEGNKQRVQPYEGIVIAPAQGQVLTQPSQCAAFFKE